jgi:hypothetical protein
MKRGRGWKMTRLEASAGAQRTHRHRRAGMAHGRTMRPGCLNQRERGLHNQATASVLVKQEGGAPGICRLRPETGRTEASDGNTAFTVSLCSPERGTTAVMRDFGADVLPHDAAVEKSRAGRDELAERTAMPPCLRPAGVAAAAFQAARCDAQGSRDESRRKTSGLGER